MFGEWLRSQRDRLLSDPGFHHRVLRFFPTRWIARRRARQLFDIAVGFSYSQTLAACVELNLFERLRNGPVSTQVLSQELSIPVDGLRSLLGSAAELDLLERCRDDVWRLGELGAASLGNPGVSAMVRHHRLLYQDLLDPVALFRNRDNSALGDYWRYAATPGASEPVTAASYSELMAVSQSFVADDVLSHCPLYDRQHLMDLGGGSGAFVEEALRRHPKLTATVVDLPHVAPLAEERLEKAGLADRGVARSGNIFEGDLPARADVISLVRILHDHDDEPVERLLRHARRALTSNGLLIIAEPMAETRGAPGVGAYFHVYLWAMRSGQPRSREKLRRMLEAAGFADVRERATYQPALVRIITARPGEGFATPAM